MKTLLCASAVILFASWMIVPASLADVAAIDRLQFVNPQQVTWSGWAKSNPTSDNPYYFNPMFISSSVAAQFDHTVDAEQRDGGTLGSGPCSCEVVLTLRLDQPVLRIGFDSLDRPLIVEAFDACNRSVGSLTVQPDSSGWSFCGVEETTGVGMQRLVIRALFDEQATGDFAVIDDVVFEGQGQPRPAADFDCNLRVDLIDFQTFSSCFGLSLPAPPACEYEDWDAADLTGDWQVNLADFATFAAQFSP